VETCILPSAVLSTHTGGFKGFTFRDLTDDMPKIEAHWVAEKILFDAVYTGYLGSVRQIDYVKDIMDKTLLPGGKKIVDPAMADNGKLYVGFDDAFVEHMKELCGYADIILPNITEACFLTGTEYRGESQDKKYVEDLLGKLGELGAKTVVLKGLSDEKGKLGNAVYDVQTENVQFYYSVRIDRNSHGTGDCFASAFTGALMRGRSMIDAVHLAADFVVECIRKTMDDEDHWYGVKFEKALPVLISGLNESRQEEAAKQVRPGRKEYVIDGNHFDDLNGFYDEIYRVMTKKEMWGPDMGHNLNSFNDILRGGFGKHAYGEPIRITWKNFGKSREELGPETAERILEIISHGQEDHDCLLVLTED